MRGIYRAAYHSLMTLGKPFGGIRPRRLYDMLGRRAYPVAEYQWFRNAWGSELYLSHHFHLDRNILIFGQYDQPLHQVIQTVVQPGMIALDVGANLGEMSLHMAQRVGPSGAVYAFEPFPGAYNRLAEHIQRNGMSDRIRPIAMALSDQAGTVTMGVPTTDADNQGIGSIVNAADPSRVGDSITVRTDSLDHFMAIRNLPRVDFIKLDIQGGEYRFLLGAKNTLASHRPTIVMEVSPTDLGCIGRTSRDLLALVESLGYAVHEVAGGTTGRCITAAQVPEHFAATNVLCIGRQ
jgi:FkbM family methyltransferase